MNSKPLRNLAGVLSSLLVMSFASGCGAPVKTGPAESPKSSLLRGVTLSDATSPAAFDHPVTLAASKNEWTAFTIQVAGLPAQDARRPYSLRIQPLNHDTASSTIAASNYSGYQVLPMPVDVNRAGFIRHTGLSASNRLLSRALLPMPTNDGLINLAMARDPAKPTDSTARAGGKGEPVLIWVDLHIPPETPHGSYSGTCDLLESGNERPIARLNIKLNVHDFVLPDERHLMMIGNVEWSDLTRLYTDKFEAVTPRLMNRTDPRYAPAVKVLDQLISLAQENRAQLLIPRLQPTVKWPAGKPPQVDWQDYDALMAPWLGGDVFKDRTPLGYWPLPTPDMLGSFDRNSQRQYWTEASSHFDQRDWLSRASVVIDSPQNTRLTTLEAVRISAEAADILSLNPRLRVQVPLEDDQVQFATEGNTELIAPGIASRLITANPGLVFNSPISNWPSGAPRPARWQRTDLTGIIPYVGAGGDERDVRLWAWFASVPIPPPQLGVAYGGVSMIQWPSALPSASSPTEPANPNELVWFYPGSWFGVDEPVPTIQLKWLRRAQQDYEYIYLARQRGATLDALLMARILTKPVELQPNQQPDPTFGLMSGAADPSVWNAAAELLAKRILMRPPGESPDEKLIEQLNLETLRWSEPQEKPVVTGRNTQWVLDTSEQSPMIRLRLGIDIYNAADQTPDQNVMKWTQVPQGWRDIRPQDIPIPQLATYHVQRFTLDASVSAAEITRKSRSPVEITFIDGFRKKPTAIRMMLPVAHCDRREGVLNINGSLEDWTTDDAIQDGAMVQMFNRPALQTPGKNLLLATTPSSIYTGWADENLYVAFKLTGLNGADTRAAKNFVGYQFRRAWGEDLCEILVQPVFADGSMGGIVQLVCKPGGQSWVEQKLDPKTNANPWQPIAGTEIRYASSIDGADWRGELAIPWKLFTADPLNRRPTMLRFNFSQHRTINGESASWAGPVDFGRDDAFTGVLVIREPQNPGMK